MRHLFILIFLIPFPALSGDPSTANCGEPEPPVVISFSGSGKPPKIDRDKGDPARWASSRLKSVEFMNEYFHDSNDQFVLGLRSLLSESGVTPKSAFVVDMIPFSNDWQMVILISGDQGIFTFDTNGKEIHGWQDVSETWMETPYCRRIDDGLRIINGDK
ncbi:MAG: hypothetical protein AAF197_03100 [Pseudomonadota bacterium]